MSSFNRYGGGTANLPLGTLKRVVVPASGYSDAIQDAEYETINENGVWIKENAVYLQSEYPDLANEIGLVNAANMTPRISNVTNSINSVVIGNNGYFISRGLYSTTSDHAYSSNGATWERFVLGVWMQDVAYGNGIYVAVSRHGTNSSIDWNGLVTSTDLVTWSKNNTLPKQDYAFVRFLNNTFVAGTTNGKIAHSSDGITWTEITVVANVVLNDIAFGDGVYCIAANNGQLYGSENLTSWKSFSYWRIPPQSGTISVLKIIYDQDLQRFICQTSNGHLFLAQKQTTEFVREYISTGVTSWTAPDGVTSVNVLAIGGGGGGIAESTYSLQRRHAGAAGGGLGQKNNIPVTPGQIYTVNVGAAGAYGNIPPPTRGGDSYFIYDQALYDQWDQNKSYEAGSEEVVYDVPGTYSWTAPPGVTSVCVVCVGAGGAGGHRDGTPISGGGGGGLGWKNNISVTPGQSYTVVVGKGGALSYGLATSPRFSGGNSYFIDTSTVAGYGGEGGKISGTSAGGGFVGDGGGNGGSSIVSTLVSGGGGAGGYTGNGGNGGLGTSPTPSNGSDGSGGGGGGGRGNAVNSWSGSGGGVGLYGIGDNGIGGTSGYPEGSAGSGGGNTFNFYSSSPQNRWIVAGNYGGGGAGFEYTSSGEFKGSAGGNGAVRIIWGVGKSFPSNAAKSSTYGKVLAQGFVAGFGGDPGLFNHALTNVVRPKGGGYVGDIGGAGGDGGMILNELHDNSLRLQFGGAGAAGGYGEQGASGEGIPQQKKLTILGNAGSGTGGSVYIGYQTSGAGSTGKAGSTGTEGSYLPPGAGYSFDGTSAFANHTDRKFGAAGGIAVGSSPSTSTRGGLVITYNKPVNFHLTFDEAYFPRDTLGDFLNIESFIAVNGNLYLCLGPYVIKTENSGSYKSKSFHLANIIGVRNFTEIRSSYPYKLAYGNGKFIFGMSSMMYETTDFVNFKPIDIKIGNPSSETIFSAAKWQMMTFENDRFFFNFGSNQFYTSTDLSFFTYVSGGWGTTSTLNSLTYGNGLYVLVGNSGQIYTSTNVTSWSSRTSGTTSSFNAVVYGSHNSTFVAGGNLGVLRTSTDGITWTTRTYSSATINGIIYGNGLYVLFGTTGTIASSTDAITWTTRTNLGYSTLTGTRGVYDSVNSKFVIYSDAMSITSTDAISWTVLPGPAFAQSLSFLDKLNSMYVKYHTTYQLTSTNLENWVSTNSISYTVYSVVYTNGRYIRAGENIGYSGYSTDLQKWYFNTNDSTPLSTTIYSTIIANDKIVYASRSGIYYTDNSVGLDFIQSKNMKSSFAIDKQINFGVKYTTYGNNLAIYAGSSGKIVYSENSGLSWHEVKDNANQQIYGLVYNPDNNKFYYLGTWVWGTSTDGKVFKAVGTVQNLSSQKFFVGNNKILGAYSSGGLSISDVSDPLYFQTIRLDGSPTMYSFIYGNEKYVAVGANGTIVTSTDERSFDVVTSNTTSTLTKIYYGNNLFVAVGNSGAIVTSTNAVEWTARTSNTTSSLSSVYYSNNLWVAIGNGGVVRSSTDGITWDSRTFGTTNNLLDVTYGDNLWVIVAQSGVLRTSTDAITWTARTSGTSSPLNAVIYTPHNGLFVAAGNSGTMRSSTDGITWDAVNTRTNTTIKDVVYDGTNYIFTSGTANIGISQDLVNWKNTGHLSFTGPLAYGNNIYLAANGGNLYKSEEEMYNWALVTLPTSSTISTITYGNGIFMYAGNNGIFATSTDTNNWNTINFNKTDTLYVHYKNNLFIVSGSSGFLQTSTDGINWISRYTGTSGTIGALDYGNSKWIVTNQNTNSNVFSSNNITSLEYAASYNAETEFFVPNFTESQTVEIVGSGEEEYYVIINGSYGITPNNTVNGPLICSWSDERGFGPVLPSTNPDNQRTSAFFHPSMKAIIIGIYTKPSAFTFNTTAGMGAVYSEAILPAELTSALISTIAVSPDGRWVVAGYSQTPWIVQWEFDVDRGFGNYTSFSSAVNSAVVSLNFNSTGTELIVGYGTSTLRTFSFTENGLGSQLISSISSSSLLTKYRPGNDSQLLLFPHTQNSYSVLLTNKSATSATSTTISNTTGARCANWDPLGNNLVVGNFSAASTPPLDFQHLSVYNINADNLVNYQYPNLSYSLTNYNFAINNVTQIYAQDAIFSPSGKAIIFVADSPIYSTGSSPQLMAFLGAIEFENSVGFKNRYPDPPFTLHSLSFPGGRTKITWGTINKTTRSVSQPNQITYVKAKL